MRRQPAPPYADGLEATIAIFTQIREASLEVSDQIVRDQPGAQIGAMTVGVPAEALDGLILSLEASKRHRDMLLNTISRTRRANYWILGFLLLNMALNVVAAILRRQG